MRTIFFEIFPKNVLYHDGYPNVTGEELDKTSIKPVEWFEKQIAATIFAFSSSSYLDGLIIQ